MPATDVIFNIGVVGAAAGGANVDKLVAGFGKLVKATKEEVYEAQKFQQVMNNLTVDMSGFGKATANLVDTMESVVGANKLVAAGASASKRQIEAIGKASVDTAQKTGKDATALYNSFITGISKGSSRALKEIGIDLEDYVSESSTLAEKQAVALELIENKFGDISVEAQTAEEKSYAFFNTVGTLKAQLVAPAFDHFVNWLGDSADGVGTLQGTLDDLSDSLSDSEGKMAEWMTSAEGLANVAGGVWAEITGDIETATTKANEFYGAQQKALKAGKGIREERVKKQAEQQAAVAASEPAKRRTGGGGKKKETPVDFDFSVEEMETGLDQQTLDLFADYGKQTRAESEAAFMGGFGEAGDVALEFDDIEDPSATDAFLSRRSAQIGMEIGLAQQKAATLAEIEAQITEDQERESQMRQANVMASAGSISGTLGNLQKTMDKNSRSGFKAAKGLALAQVAVDTPAAAMAAYKSVVGIPYVGPVLAVVAASAAVAAGLAQMANIRKQKYSGGGSSSASVSSSGISAPNISSSANQYGAGATGGGGTTIYNNVMVDGQVIHSSMINANDDAAQRNEEHFSVAS